MGDDVNNHDLPATGGFKVIESVYVSDYENIMRTWRERLFTLPWRPWVKTRRVYAPSVYKMGDTLICSPATANKLGVMRVEWETDVNSR